MVQTLRLYLFTQLQTAVTPRFIAVKTERETQGTVSTVSFTRSLIRWLAVRRADVAEVDIH
jgi:hypothetical protein